MNGIVQNEEPNDRSLCVSSDDIFSFRVPDPEEPLTGSALREYELERRLVEAARYALDTERALTQERERSKTFRLSSLCAGFTMMNETLLDHGTRFHTALQRLPNVAVISVARPGFLMLGDTNCIAAIAHFFPVERALAIAHAVGIRSGSMNIYIVFLIATDRGNAILTVAIEKPMNLTQARNSVKHIRLDTTWDDAPIWHWEGGEHGFYAVSDVAVSDDLARAVNGITAALPIIALPENIPLPYPDVHPQTPLPAVVVNISLSEGDIVWEVDEK